MSATVSSYLNFHVITLTVGGDQCDSWRSSLRYFLHIQVMPSLLAADAL